MTEEVMDKCKLHNIEIVGNCLMANGVSLQQEIKMVSHLHAYNFKRIAGVNIANKAKQT